MNLVTLNPPSFEIATDGSGNLGTKRYFFLKNAALRYEGGIPADAEIVRSYLVSEQMVDYPAGCYGDVTWGFYSQLYENLSGVPARERCQPMGTALLGRLLLRPGADTESWRDHPGIPYTGERLGVFFQVASAPSRKFSLFSGLLMRSATGFVELPGIVYHDVPNTPAAGIPAYSYRNTYSEIPEGGDEVRVTVATLGEPLALSHMSIGVRDGSSGFNMKAPPVPVTFSATPGPYSFVRSEWAPLATQAGDALLVHSCLSGGWAFKDVFTEDGNPGSYVAGVSGHDTQNFIGTPQVLTVGPYQYHRKHAVAMIEVR